MKKFTALLFLLLAVTTFSCSSSNDNNPIVDGHYIRFTADGQNYDIPNPETLTSLKTLFDAHQGSDATLRRISLWIPNDATAGTHAITNAPSDLQSYGATYYQGNDITVDGTSGTFVITTIDATHVVGTFSFTGDNAGTPFTVSNGTFRVER